MSVQVLETARCPYCAEEESESGTIFLDVRIAKKLFKRTESNNDIDRMARFNSMNWFADPCSHLVYCYLSLEAVQKQNANSQHCPLTCGWWLAPKFRGEHDRDLVVALSSELDAPENSRIHHLVDFQDYSHTWEEDFDPLSDPAVYVTSGIAVFTLDIQEFASEVDRRKVMAYESRDVLNE
jgi:hypothetical protein